MYILQCIMQLKHGQETKNVWEMGRKKSKNLLSLKSIENQLIWEGKKTQKSGSKILSKFKILNLLTIQTETILVITITFC